MTKKTKFPLWLFAVIFVVASLLPIINRQLSPAKTTFLVRDNSGMGRVLTYENMLVTVFSNGNVCAWDWKTLDKQFLWQLSTDSDRLAMLDEGHAAVVTKTGRKNIVVYDVKKGVKFSETPVGWEDQDVRLLQSPDKKILALACINPDKDGHTLYEFMLIDPAKGKPDLPVSIDVQSSQKRLIAFALSNDKKVLAAGSTDKKGWLAAIDLNQGKEILRTEYPDYQEFTGVAVVPDNLDAFLTNRNGSVYGIDSTSGEIKSTYTVLEPGQKNPVTNDTSSQNVTISDDGRYVAAVMIEHKVAVWDIRSGKPVFQVEPGHKLTGPIALSSDGSLLATSDKRASGTIRIWQVKK